MDSIRRTVWLATAAAVLVATASAGNDGDAKKTFLGGIPTVLASNASSGKFSLRGIGQIVVDFNFETAVDSQGSTLIPPTLRQFATTFAQDVSSTFSAHPVVGTGGRLAANGVFLTLGDPKDYLDVAGRQTSEGYSLVVNSSGITIIGASPLGVWWGTRTVLQQAILNNGTVPYGSVTDAPGWGTRGMMLDVGRHFYPKDFIKEMCAYMSFFKQNTFHLHLSDNLFNHADYARELSLDLYARLRLWSDEPALAGLNRFKNESYTREDFEDIQLACAARGVTILPEIESPGHSLVIVQWKPQLGYKSDLSLLNISHPETIPTVKAIWGTFLPWFHSKVVSIGADEYRGPEAEYNAFVNDMNIFIGETSNKSVRIWGTFPPKGDPSNPGNIHRNISVQHWEFFEDDPLTDFIMNNYSVVNSNDDFYIVNKYGSYPATIDIRKTFHGGPPNAGPWYPHVFHQSVPEKNPALDNPFVLGSIAPLWNDYGPETSVYLEAYYAWREGLPALADKQWGGTLSEADFPRVFEALRPFIPGQNLERNIPSKTNIIFNYDFDDLLSSENGSLVADASPNTYHAETDCELSDFSGLESLEMDGDCAMVTPLSSKGRNYTLTLTLKISSVRRSAVPATLIFGGDSSLVLTGPVSAGSGTGTGGGGKGGSGYKMALYASGVYFSVNSAVPLGEWTVVTLSGVGTRTYVTVSSLRSGRLGAKEEIQTRININGRDFHMAEIAIEAPLRRVGGREAGWTGQLGGFSLSRYLY